RPADARGVALDATPAAAAGEAQARLGRHVVDPQPAGEDVAALDVPGGVDLRGEPRVCRVAAGAVLVDPVAGRVDGTGMDVRLVVIAVDVLREAVAVSVHGLWRP